MMSEISNTTALDAIGNETWRHGCETHRSVIEETVVIDTLTDGPLLETFLVHTHSLLHVIVERFGGGSLQKFRSPESRQEPRIQPVNKGEQM